MPIKNTSRHELEDEIDHQISTNGYAVIKLYDEDGNIPSGYQEFFSFFNKGCRVPKDANKINHFAFIHVKPKQIDTLSEIKYCEKHNVSTKKSLTNHVAQELFPGSSRSEAGRRALDLYNSIAEEESKDALSARRGDSSSTRITVNTTVGLIFWPEKVIVKAKKVSAAPKSKKKSRKSEENLHALLIDCVSKAAKRDENDIEYHQRRIQYHKRRLKEIKSRGGQLIPSPIVHPPPSASIVKRFG